MHQLIEISNDLETVLPAERARLVRLCATITGNGDVAEDLAQETLLEAWRHLHKLRDPERRAQWLTGIARNVCLRFFVFALVPLLPALVIANIISGLGAGPLNPIMSTVEQEVVPAEMRARVLGTTMAGAYLGIPLGAFLCGYLVQWAGLTASLLVIGTCYLLTTTSLLVNPALRGMERS